MITKCTKGAETVTFKQTFNLDLKVRKGNISYNKLASQMDLHLNTVRRWFNDSEMDAVQIGRVMNAINEIEEKESKVVQ